MSFVAQNPESKLNAVVGNGHCVAYVRAVTNLPSSSTWKAGGKVRGDSSIVSGTAIATFEKDGSYADNPTGQHAAIFVEATDEGLRVYDQWVGQPVSLRLIRFRNGQGSRSNDGDAFSVIETK
jgi:hypothetical protein